MEYALKRVAPGTFEEVAEAVERSIDAHGFVVVGAHDVHVTLATKGFRIHPVRIYEIRDAEAVSGGAGRALRAMRHESVAGRINVFFEEERVVVAAVRPDVVAQMFPEAGLEAAAADMERRIIAVVDEVVADLSERS